MSVSASLILLLVSIILFVLAAFKVSFDAVLLVPLGLACFAAAHLPFPGPRQPDA